MIKLTSFETDIRPLFTERDIQGMSKAFNLASYDEVKAHAVAIYDRIRGIGGNVMPPPPPREKALGLNFASIYSLNGWLTAAPHRVSQVDATASGPTRPPAFAVFDNTAGSNPSRSSEFPSDDERL